MQHIEKKQKMKLAIKKFLLNGFSPCTCRLPSHTRGASLPRSSHAGSEQLLKRALFSTPYAVTSLIFKSHRLGLMLAEHMHSTVSYGYILKFTWCKKIKTPVAGGLFKSRQYRRLGRMFQSWSRSVTCREKPLVFRPDVTAVFTLVWAPPARHPSWLNAALV